jgi:protoporphyrinogen oxidase
MKKTKIQYLILRAGPAGLSAAYKLSQAGRAVTIVDRSKVCGGLMRNVEKGALPTMPPKAGGWFQAARLSFASNSFVPVTMNYFKLAMKRFEI